MIFSALLCSLFFIYSMKHKKIVDLVYKFTLNILSNLLISTFFSSPKEQLSQTAQQRTLMCIILQ